MDALQRAEQSADAIEIQRKIETIQEAARVISAKASTLAQLYQAWQDKRDSGIYPDSDIDKLAARLNVQKLKTLVTAANDYLA